MPKGPAVTKALALGAMVLLSGQTVAMRGFPINDPVLQMRAWTLTAPANWNVEGTMLPPASCTSGTSPIYSAVSPDGSAGKMLYPRSDWAWGAGVGPSNDCLPFRSAVRANDFLTYQIRALKLGFVRDEPVPDLAESRASFGNGYYDEARALVRYSVAGKPMEALLNVSISCQDADVAAIGLVHQCRAFVKRSFAPLGKLDAMRATFDAMKMQLNPQWMRDWQSAMTDRTNQLSRSQTRAMLYQGALAQQQRTAEHQAFMTSFQQGADRRDIDFKAGQYQKRSNTEDFIDHIMDCQRAYVGNERVSAINCPPRQTY